MKTHWRTMGRSLGTLLCAKLLVGIPASGSTEPALRESCRDEAARDRVVGRDVTVKLLDGVALQGRMVSFDSTCAVLRPDGWQPTRSSRTIPSQSIRSIEYREGDLFGSQVLGFVVGGIIGGLVGDATKPEPTSGWLTIDFAPAVHVTFFVLVGAAFGAAAGRAIANPARPRHVIECP